MSSSSPTTVPSTVGNASRPSVASNVKSNSSVGSNGKKLLNATKSTVSGVMSKLGEFTGESTLIVILIIAFALLFIIVIIYITFKIKSSSLQGKRLTQVPLKLDKMSAPFEVPGAIIPTPMVGLEYTYGFWMYIENLEQTGGSHRMIFYRGESGNLTNANPVVVMDGLSNKLYIVIKTTNSSLSSANLPQPTSASAVTYEGDLSNITKFNCFNNKSDPTCIGYENKHIILPIDYIPIQRWVHVMFSVDNKLVTVYMDGEIYSVKSVDELKTMKNLSENLVLDKTVGSVFVGKNPKIGNGNTMTGYLSRLEFFNYALSLNDVKRIYSSGPLSRGILSMLGLSNYGVRAPIYRIDDISEVQQGQ